MIWRRSGSLAKRAIDEELQHHILERIDALIDQGYEPVAARREAERRFGDVGMVREALRTLHGAAERERRWSEFGWSVLRDLRLGCRHALSAPGFAAAIVLTIGVGVGANAALFSVTDAVLLRPLPYAERDHLYSIDHFLPEQDRVIERWSAPAARRFESALQDDVRVLLFGTHGFVRTGIEDPHSVLAGAVTPEWADLLGVRPMMGRAFVPTDADPSSPAVVVLGHELWRSRFGADPAVLGAEVMLDRVPYRVIGVMGPEFRFPPIASSEAWVPLRGDGTVDGVQEVRGLRVIGHSLDAMAMLQDRATAVELDPDMASGTPRVTELDSFRANSDVRRALAILTLVAALMLGIAIINSANLMLVRARARRVELEVRKALGATRARLVRQTATEFVVLAGAGALVAMGLAKLSVNYLAGHLPGEITFFLTSAVVVDTRVLGFALALTLLAAFGAGVLPAWRAAASRGAGRRVTGGAAGGARRALLVAQVAMTVALLAGASLMMRSFMNLTAVDPGYDAEGLVQFSVALPPGEYGEAASQHDFYDRLRQRLQSVPGVQNVSLADGVPPRAGFSFNVSPQVEGGEPRDLPGILLPRASVDANYFTTLGTRVLAGRAFGPEDDGQPDNVVIDQAFARFLWGDEPAVGRRFRLDPDGSEPWFTVVGVVEDVKLMGQDDRHGALEMFQPLQPAARLGFMSMLVRAEVPVAEVLQSVRAVVRELDPNLPLARIESAQEALAASADKPRFYLQAMALFATLSLALAVVGTYATLAFLVRGRRHELGVRAALGATPRGLRGLVLRQGLGIAVVGLGLGLFGGYGIGRAAGSLLFAVTPSEPAAFGFVAVITLLSALAASWFPAVQATRADPNEVLRSE